MVNGGCIISQEDLSKSNSVPLLTKISALHVTSKNNTQSTVFTQVCPGGKAKCPDSATCCKLSSGEYACCPIPNEPGFLLSAILAYAPSQLIKWRSNQKFCSKGDKQSLISA
ncbi:unnamed protein product [Schistosoma curassoni]|uniref:GRANULINS domain-containing protein n=1 Tax=Schistosoma curassoni TaxID=6186 RepID=A0A183JRM0_9TREM|nr:unnamed protein product [Schistosoma curassoni]